MEPDAAEFAAVYFDGQRAKKHEVRVTVGPSGIRIIASDDALLEIWASDDLDIRPSPSSQGIILSCRRQEDASLELDDPAAVSVVRKILPRQFARSLPARQALRLGLSVAGVLGAVALIVFWAIPASAPILATLVPASFKEQLGDVFVSMGQRYGYCNAPEGREALDALTLRLLPDAPTQGVKVVVVDHSMVNAFAAPGGRIVIMRGLIAGASGPDEVAGVLAHELGHHLEDHAIRNMIRYGSYALIVDLITGGSGVIATAASVGTITLALSHQRDDERAADRIGAELLESAGLSAHGLAEFFSRQQSRTARAVSSETAGGNAVEADGKDDGAGTGGEDDAEVIKKKLAEIAGTVLETLQDYASTHPIDSERKAYFLSRPASDRPALDARQWQALKTICSTTSRDPYTD